MFLSGPFLVAQPVHWHQHTRAARARKSANMDSANMPFVAPMRTGCASAIGASRMPSRSPWLPWKADLGVQGCGVSGWGVSKY